MIKHYIHNGIRFFFDAPEAGGAGGVVHKPNPTPDDKGGSEDDTQKSLEEMKNQHEEMKKRFDEMQSRYADMEQQNREFGRMKKKFEDWQNRMSSEPDKVIEEMGGDPTAVAAKTFPELLGDDEEPEWKKAFAELSKKLDDTVSFKEQEQQKQSHYQRFAQLKNYMSTKEVQEKFPFVAMMGDAALEQISQQWGNEEAESGYAPPIAQLLEQNNKMLDNYNKSTVELWAKNKAAAERMINALQDAGYSFNAVGRKLTLMNEDESIESDRIDPSKLSGDALIRHNMKMAELAAEAEAKRR